MEKNEGKFDRITRVILGLALIVVAFVTDIYWLLIGVVPLVTGAVGFCPAYKLLGVSTCSTKNQAEGQ